MWVRLYKCGITRHDRAGQAVVIFALMKNTIVIVDDARTCQQILEKIALKLGFKVQLCDDGEDSIEYLHKHIDQIVAVFLDIYMPRIDGISTLGHFRSKYPDLPVYIITSSDDIADERVVKSLGAVAFFKKPFVIEEIRGEMEGLRG